MRIMNRFIVMAVKRTVSALQNVVFVDGESPDQAFEAVIPPESLPQPKGGGAMEPHSVSFIFVKEVAGIIFTANTTNLKLQPIPRVKKCGK